MNKHTRKAITSTLRLANRDNAKETHRIVGELLRLADHAKRYADRLTTIADKSAEASKSSEPSYTIADDARWAMDAVVSDLAGCLRTCESAASTVGRNAAAARAAFDAFAGTEDDEAEHGDAAGDAIDDRDEDAEMVKSVRTVLSMSISHFADFNENASKANVVAYVEGCDLDYDTMGELLKDFGIDHNDNEGERRERLERVANDAWVELRVKAVRLAKLGASPVVVAEAI